MAHPSLPPLLRAIPSPVLFRGDEHVAYRDPAVVFDQGTFHLFFTIVTHDAKGTPFLQLAVSRSTDLLDWTPLEFLTPKDPRLNYSSPGNVVRFDNEWVLCCQTYPRPNGEKYGNATSRLFTMRSANLREWTPPSLLKVKGPDVAIEDMGRMIDPYLFPDKDDAGKWWCFYKQDGVSMSWSRDLENWTFAGRTDAGENSCVVVRDEQYVLFHSPENGIGVKRSPDLAHWKDEGVFHLGQKEWSWAAGRLTAGFVLDLRHDPRVGKFLLFFHGSGPEDERTMFDTHASIGLAWSDSLDTWEWSQSANP